MRRGTPAYPVVALVLLLLAAAGGHARGEDAMPAPAAILQELKSFNQLGSVLYVAAHPDDENTLLITYLSRGLGVRTAYLSLNRGEGGQNELGPVFNEELGVARTQELLSARRLDGGQQFFTRAFDFGYSKSPEETLRIWDRQQVLADIVRVIREFRPDVLVARFPLPPSNTHGHHTASTILAVEAFNVAGDPKAFPEQIAEGLTPWQPKRILLNAGGGGRGGAGASGVVRLSVGGNDPVTGESFASIAARSRAMHKTQGFGNFGGGGRGGAATESFTLLGGEPATTSIFDGVDATWARFPGGAEIGKLAEDAIAKFNPQDLAASVPALLEIKSKLAALPKDDIVINAKRAQLDRILQNCLGLSVETTIANPEVVPGETMKLREAVLERSTVPVRWLGARYPGSSAIVGTAEELKANEPATRDVTETLSADTPISQPYWLREERTPGMFVVSAKDTPLIGQPENPPAFPIEQVFEIGGQQLVIPDQPWQLPADPAKGGLPRKLDVIPPVTLHFPFGVKLFAPGAAKDVTVQATANRPGTAGTLQLEAPAGWKVAPASQAFSFAQAGQSANYTFTVTAPSSSAQAKITAYANVNGARYDNDREVIAYSHIPLQLLMPPARLKAVSLDMQIRGTKVGYLPGAGDDVAQCLEQMGYKVTTLTGADLTPEKLKDFDAVVIGVRAFNERDDLAANLPGLFAYVQNGGTVIAQYNRPGGQLPPLGPYPLSIAGGAPALRVTDETAPVTFLVPDHPVLNTPNKITAADFDGWVQERGAYFPSSWDEHYVELLGVSDPGETQPSSSVLIAQYGKGYFVYTTLAWFRQLPAGVPGAYRLFANLVSLGK